MSLAITGATGRLGNFVLAQLLEKVQAKDIIALARTTARLAPYSDRGIQVREFDYGGSASELQKALAGVETLLLISSSEVSRRVPQHKAVIDAAKASGVKTLVYTSLLHADISTLILAEEHRESEAYLKSSGLHYIILRNGWYIENHIPSIADAIVHGALLGAAKDGKYSSASRADYAAAAVAVLTTGSPDSKTYELAGDTSFTLSELAAQIFEASGKQVTYI